MFDAGALPRSYATTKNDDQVTWVQQGRAAFTVLPFARFAQLNNKDQSTFPGKIKAVEFPISSALKGKVPMAAVVESWAMVIPANARNKDLSWSYIQAMSSKAVTTGAARNGNGPVRVSTYADPSFRRRLSLLPLSRRKCCHALGPLSRPSRKRCGRKPSSLRKCNSPFSGANRSKRRSRRSGNV